MSRLTNEQIILIILVIIALVVGSGVLLWQKLNNDPIIAGLIERESPNVENPVLESEAVPVEEDQEVERVVVHVAGEVNNPGVYELTGEVRVIDVIRAAGGESVQADLERLNLAAHVYDGEKVYIPAAGEKVLNSPDGIDNSQGGGGIRHPSRLNINTATGKQLQQLPGIGPSKAGSILKYRQQIGRFKELDQLLEVNGIGQKTLEQIKDALSL